MRMAGRFMEETCTVKLLGKPRYSFVWCGIGAKLLKKTQNLSRVKSKSIGLTGVCWKKKRRRRKKKKSSKRQGERQAKVCSTFDGWIVGVTKLSKQNCPCSDAEMGEEGETVAQRRDSDSGYDSVVSGYDTPAMAISVRKERDGTGTETPATQKQLYQVLEQKEVTKKSGLEREVFLF